MQKQLSDASTVSGRGPAVGGVLLAFVSGLFIGQAGGSDRETFLAIGFLLGAVGLLGIVIGGVTVPFPRRVCHTAARSMLGDSPPTVVTWVDELST